MSSERQRISLRPKKNSASTLETDDSTKTNNIETSRKRNLPLESSQSNSASLSSSNDCRTRLTRSHTLKRHNLQSF